MNNPVLAETGDFALSIPVTLTFYGGDTFVTRGVMGLLPQSPEQLEGTYSDSGRCAWVPDPERAERVEFLSAEGRHWRVLDSEPVGGGLFASVDYRVVRYMLIDEEVVIEPTLTDFDPVDYDPVDFN